MLTYAADGLVGLVLIGVFMLFVFATRHVLTTSHRTDPSLIRFALLLPLLTMAAAVALCVAVGHSVRGWLGW